MAGGRPPIPIDLDKLEKLAQRQWSKRSIAAFFNVSEETIERRFADIIEKNYAVGRAHLIDRGWEMIQKGSERMLIKFLENYCDFKTKADIINSIDVTVMTGDTQEKVKAAAERIDGMLAELRDVTPEPSLPKGLLPDSGKG